MVEIDVTKAKLNEYIYIFKEYLQTYCCKTQILLQNKLYASIKLPY